MTHRICIRKTSSAFLPEPSFCLLIVGGAYFTTQCIVAEHTFRPQEHRTQLDYYGEHSEEAEWNRLFHLRHTERNYSLYL